MKKGLVVFGVYWVVALMVVPFDFAWGYIDPATTTYIIQIAAALVVTLGVSLGVVVYKFQMIATNVRVSAHAFARRLGKKQDSSKMSDFHEGSVSEQSEEEALAAGVLDCAIPVRTNYPGLAPEYVMTSVPSESEPTPEVDHSFSGRLRSFGHRIWKDDRSFKTRLLIAVLIAAALAITFVIFSMLDSVILNRAELSFSYEEVAGSIMLLALGVFAAIAIVLAVLRGRVFDFVACALLSLLVCGYLQITFLNASMGKIIGRPMGWADLGFGAVLINLVIWVAIFAVIFFLGFSKRPKAQRFYRQFAVFVPSLLIVVQLVALASVIPSTQDENHGPPPSSSQFVTTEHIYDVSSENNIVVFVLDMFDKEFVDQILVENPEVFDGLDGFTLFSNNMSRYNETFPSVVNLMTGVPYDYKTGSRQYIDQAYQSGAFVEDLRAQGFKSDLYIEKWYTYTDATPLRDIADNAEALKHEIDLPWVIERLGWLTALKSVPLGMKQVFSMVPETFSQTNGGVKTKGHQPYTGNDYVYNEKLREKGLRPIDAPNHFSLTHLTGSHYPWHMNAEVSYVEEGTTGKEQTMGVFKILGEYFRQMKELGIYKDATIIITGDHPTHTNWQEIEGPMLTGLLVKPAGSERTPLVYNNAPVSIDNFRATCVDAAGGDGSAWGRTYFEVGQDEIVERHYYNRYAIKEKGVNAIAHYRVIGDANDWHNWEHIETIPFDPTLKTIS